jgi:hypothetical protein
LLPVRSPRSISKLYLHDCNAFLIYSHIHDSVTPYWPCLGSSFLSFLATASTTFSLQDILTSLMGANTAEGKVPLDLIGYSTVGISRSCSRSKRSCKTSRTSHSCIQGVVLGAILDIISGPVLVVLQQCWCQGFRSCSSQVRVIIVTVINPTSSSMHDAALLASLGIYGSIQRATLDRKLNCDSHPSTTVSHSLWQPAITAIYPWRLFIQDIVHR